MLDAGCWMLDAGCWMAGVCMFLDGLPELNDYELSKS